MTKEGPLKLGGNMTVQEAIQRLVNIARNNLNYEQSANGYAYTVEACEKLEEIFRLTLKREVRHTDSELRAMAELKKEEEHES